jgi:hypothetical protein
VFSTNVVDTGEQISPKSKPGPFSKPTRISYRQCKRFIQRAGVWTALKRVLLYDKLEIQTFDAYFQFSQASLKPEPIDVNG